MMEYKGVVIPLQDYNDLVKRVAIAELLLTQEREKRPEMIFEPGKITINPIKAGSNPVSPIPALTEDEARAIEEKALDTYGPPAQILMAYEEMGELMKELSKHERGKDNNLQIAEEIADVRIMLEQMALLFGVEQDCDRIRYEKLIRLKERLSHAEHSH